MELLLSEMGTVEVQAYLQHLVAPRPIGLVSTMAADGSVNLSPFSFFNIFSSRPPVVIFSPARRVRDNTIKHTLENVLEVPEVVINLVSYAMVEQVSLASGEFARGVDEFMEAGFTKQAATLVRPPMVAESPAKLECKVVEVKALGTEGGAGNLVICEVVAVHIDEAVLDEAGMVDPLRLDLAARLGGDWYCRVGADNLFRVAKPKN